MASLILNRVGMVIATTGQGTVTANTLISNRYNTPAEAGAVNGSSYYWLLEEDNDYELFEGIWTVVGTTVARNTVLMSKIGGVFGTTKMNLAGNATLRSVGPAELLNIVAGTSADVRSILAANNNAAVRALLGLVTSSTDNGVPRYDSTSGNMQTSNVTITDADKVVAPGGIGSYEFTIADDAAASFPLPSGMASAIVAIAKRGVRSSSLPNGTVGVRAEAGGSDCFKLGFDSAATLVDTTTGALGGTTGTDTHTTISAHTDGKVYIENRTGTARVIGVSILNSV